MFENWQGYCPGAWNIKLYFWDAQTFTPQASHDLTHVFLRLYRIDSNPGEKVYCQIHNTVAGKPSGAFLQQRWFYMDELPLAPGETWKKITFDPVIPLAAGVMYAIVCWASNQYDPYALWRYQPSGNPYPRGHQVWSYNGRTWTIQATADFRFQEWGFPT
jgi:hypothetical protein